MELLNNHEVWIANTGASNHSTLSKRGAINEQPSKILAQGVTGKPVASTCEMNFPITVYD